jgi:hypothetical protein
MHLSACLSLVALFLLYFDVSTSQGGAVPIFDETGQAVVATIECKIQVRTQDAQNRPLPSGRRGFFLSYDVSSRAEPPAGQPARLICWSIELIELCSRPIPFNPWMLRSHAIFTTGFCVKRPQIGKHSTGIAEIKDLPDPGCVFDAIGLPPGTSFPLPVKRPHLRFEMPY